MSNKNKPASALPEHLQKPPSDEFDPGNLKDRTTEMLSKLDKEFSDADGEFETREHNALEEAVLNNQPLPSADPRIRQGEPGAVDFGVMPELKDLFAGKDYLVKQFFPEGLGDNIDTGIGLDPNKIKAKKVFEPEDIYDAKLDPRKERFLFALLFGTLPSPGQAGQMTLGDDIALQLYRLAKGSGVPTVAWLRQKLWPVLSRNKVKALTEAPQDRNPQDDDLDMPRTRENIMLRLLVEESNYERLADLGRLNNCSNVSAFRYMLKEIHGSAYGAFIN